MRVIRPIPSVGNGAWAGRIRGSVGWAVALMLLPAGIHPQESNGSPNIKLAQTGYQFLSVSSDARAGALADAMTTAESGAGSLFFNPAGLAHLSTRFEMMVSQNDWIADITHHSLALALNPLGGRFGTLGFSLMNVDYGEFIGTMRWDNLRGYVDTGIFKPTAIAVGAGYARILSDRFSVGAHVKYASQYLGEARAVTAEDTTLDKLLSSAVAYDFGTIYKTGFRSLVMGMSVRNFSNEIKYAVESFQLPLTFRIGVAIDLFDLLGGGTSRQSLRMSVDASHPRSHPEQVSVGVEYKALGALVLRGGYVNTADEQGISFGLGLHVAGISFDYAYTPYGVFDNVQRFSLRFGL